MIGGDGRLVLCCPATPPFGSASDHERPASAVLPCHWNMARQRYCRRLSRYRNTLHVSADLGAPAAALTRAETRGSPVTRAGTAPICRRWVTGPPSAFIISCMWRRWFPVASARQESYSGPRSPKVANAGSKYIARRGG